jgi:uncharacterized phage protein (TIGR01671 family)
MNREIKFRAWNGRAMREVDQITFTEKTWMCEGGYGVSIPFQPHITLMQYTGLKDKNGKDTYEGDIVDTWPFYQHQYNCKGKNRCQKIVFDSGGFFVEGFNFGWEGEGTIRIEHCEVIGNIYEHPRLLNTEKESI